MLCELPGSAYSLILPLTFTINTWCMNYYTTAWLSWEFIGFGQWKVFSFDSAFEYSQHLFFSRDITSTPGRCVC